MPSVAAHHAPHLRLIPNPPAANSEAMNAPASSRSEGDLLALAQQGDTRAYAELVRMHERRVLACAFQILKSPSAAEDAAQETFVRAWKALERFDGRAKLSTWLYRICVNVCYNHVRKGKRHRAADVDDPSIPEPVADVASSNPHESLQAKNTTARVREAVDALSDSLRSAVELVLLQGMSHREAGEVLGCSEGTVGWRIHEARRKLREQLGDLFMAEASGTS